MPRVLDIQWSDDPLFGTTWAVECDDTAKGVKKLLRKMKRDPLVPKGFLCYLKELYRERKPKPTRKKASA